MLIWIIGLPFLSFVLLGVAYLFANQKTQPVWTWLASLMLFGSFVLSVVGAVRVVGGDEVILLDLGSWMQAGEFDFKARFVLDVISSIMTLLITGIGFLVHVYSLGYMKDDPAIVKYFAFLGLFCGCMLVLVTSSSLPLLFIGWEGVGLASFLLIGFWYQDTKKAFAGRKAFVVNRIGDAAFVLAMALALDTFGTLEFSALSPNLNQMSQVFSAISQTRLEWIAILLFVGCMGKSAQFPLYLWLPDAMAGPTPVSALIHAATMVTAGVYVLVRLAPMYAHAPTASLVVMIVGLITAFFAATVAWFQYDIKKVLAYSTVSQLGFMVIACGLGAYAAGMFHLITHAYFKGLLFLGAGSVIHNLHHEQDMRNMGGLKTRMVATTVTFMMGYLAIIGFPLFSGFFSKDHILYYASQSPHRWVFWIAFASALLTALYMTRLVALVFMGSTTRVSLAKSQEIHEAPNSMLIPMWILAVLSLAGGWKIFSFYGVLKSKLPKPHLAEALWGMTEMHIAIVSTLGVLLVAGFTFRYYLRKSSSLHAHTGLAAVMEKQWFVNDLLERASAWTSNAMAWASSMIESFITVGLIGGFRFVLLSISRGVISMATGVLQGYVFFLLLGLIFMIYFAVGMK